MRLLPKNRGLEKCTYSKDSKTDLSIETEKYQHESHYFGNFSDFMFLDFPKLMIINMWNQFKEVFLLFLNFYPYSAL